jgi:hypothetical protein
LPYYGMMSPPGLRDLGGTGMCVPSVVADDWITKGCHIRVDRIELALRPNHLGGVVFSSVWDLAGPGRAVTDGEPAETV